ncbi:MAG: hypothetical protein FWC62_03695 [Firmicutes bacterium]|nr:hypothetical protein [Bacillota bacterium]
MMSEFEEKLNSILSSPEELEKITKLAQSFMGGDAKSPEPPSAAGNLSALGNLLPEGVDMASLTRMLGALGSGQRSESQQLLEAIKPHLKEKRRVKIDRAMQLARMAKLAQTAFLTQKDGREEPHAQL